MEEYKQTQMSKTSLVGLTLSGQHKLH